MQEKSPEKIAALLGQAIREKVFAPGAPLIQEDLAQRFQVSRSPVREALRILAAEGVVTMPPGGAGATVRRLSLADLTELYDLRLILEPAIAPLLVEVVAANQVRELRQRAETMVSIDEVEPWMRANFEFHLALYALSGRPHTEGVLRSLLSAVQPYSLENIERLGGRTQADNEHLEMVDAIENGDAPALAELIRTHLASARQRLIDKFARDSEQREVDPLAMLRTPGGSR